MLLNPTEESLSLEYSDGRERPTSHIEREARIACPLTNAVK